MFPQAMPGNHATTYVQTQNCIIFSRHKHAYIQHFNILKAVAISIQRSILCNPTLYTPPPLI